MVCFSATPRKMMPEHLHVLHVKWLTVASHFSPYAWYCLDNWDYFWVQGIYMGRFCEFSAGKSCLPHQPNQLTIWHPVNWWPPANSHWTSGKQVIQSPVTAGMFDTPKTLAKTIIPILLERKSGGGISKNGVVSNPKCIYILALWISSGFKILMKSCEQKLVAVFDIFERHFCST